MRRAEFGVTESMAAVGAKGLTGKWESGVAARDTEREELFEKRNSELLSAKQL